MGEALYEAEAARLSQHSGPPTEDSEGDAENALDDDQVEGVSDDEDDEEEGVSDDEDDEDADGGAEDAQEEAVLAEELAEELVEGEQQLHGTGPAVEENGMQSGDDKAQLMYMEQDAH